MLPKTLPPSKILRSLALSVSVLLCVSCATAPQSVSFQSIVDSNASIKQKAPERLSFDVEADCDPSTGMCELPEENLARLVQIVTLLQDEIERRVEAGNLAVDSLTHCEYANQKYREALELTENRATRDQIASAVKQIALAGACGFLIW